MLSGLPRYTLRCIITGALATRSRLHKFDPEESPDCPHCPGVPETTQHIFGECPKYKTLRFTDLGEETWTSLPPCLKYHGIVPLLNEQIAAQFQSQVDHKQLGCIVQHNLLDIWQERQKWVEARQPVPRWGEAR